MAIARFTLENLASSATATAVLRIPSSGGGATEFGLPQALVVAGVVVLLLVLAGIVLWRVRRTRSK